MTTTIPLIWDAIFLLPNLVIPKPSPFRGGPVRICAGDDPAMNQLKANLGNATALQMLQRFRGQFGRAYIPACLLVSSTSPAAARTASALRSFRSECAVATLLTARAGGQWQLAYSDHFDLYPLAPASDGHIVTNDAIVRGLHTLGDFQGQCSPLVQDPGHFGVNPSRRLLCRLIQAWRICYLERRRRGPLLRLFRSIELVFHACSFPTDGLLSLYDVGLQATVWVSAFEVLLHPGQRGQQVNLPTVLASLQDVLWRDPRLKRRRHRVRYWGQVRYVPLPQALYVYLYQARNNFAHGNRISASSLRARSMPDFNRVLASAPLIYRGVLEQQLNAWLPSREVSPPAGAPGKWLRSRRGRLYMHQRAAEWADRDNTERGLLEEV